MSKEQHDAFVSDAPLVDSEKDEFNRGAFAQRIAHTISARKDASSIVVAVYGIWGEGKTSVLNFIRGELAASEGGGFYNRHNSKIPILFIGIIYPIEQNEH